MTGELFDQVTYGLELPGTANHLRQLLMTPDVEAQEPAYSVGFSSGIGAEVSLPEQDKGISFRLIRCSRLVLVVNDGSRPIVVRGRHLPPGGVMPLTNGQVVLLPGFVAAAYDAVRTAGGVCVADEVQIGFGRVGSHRWGFQLHGVVPDIVTLGKPIGNGRRAWPLRGGWGCRTF